jgi:hypothetical protein
MNKKITFIMPLILLTSFGFLYGMKRTLKQPVKTNKRVKRTYPSQDYSLEKAKSESQEIKVQNSLDKRESGWQKIEVIDNYQAALSYYNNNDFVLAKTKFFQAYKYFSPAYSIEDKIKLINISSFLAYIAEKENNTSIERDHLISANWILDSINDSYIDPLNIKERKKAAQIKRLLEQIKEKYQFQLTALCDQNFVMLQLYQEIAQCFQEKKLLLLEVLATYLDENHTIPKSIISYARAGKAYIYCSDYFLKTFQNKKAKHFWKKGLDWLKKGTLLKIEPNIQEQQIQQYCNRLLGTQMLKNSHLFGESCNMVEVNNYIINGYPDIKPTEKTAPYHPVTVDLLQEKRQELDNFLEL